MPYDSPDDSFNLTNSSLDPSGLGAAPTWAALLKKRAYCTGSGQLNTVALGGHVRGVLANPAGSGRAAIVQTLIAASSVVPVFGRLWLNPTVAPATANTIHNMNMGSDPVADASVCTFRSDVAASPLSGGTNTGVDLPLSNSGNLAAQNYLVPPGMSLGIDVTLSGIAALSLVLYLYEDSVW